MRAHLYIAVVALSWLSGDHNAEGFVPRHHKFATTPDGLCHRHASRRVIMTMSPEASSSSFNKRHVPVDSRNNADFEFVSECALPTEFGMFRLRSYRYGDAEPTVVFSGSASQLRGQNTLLRIHDQCFTSEVLGSMRCDCNEQLQEAFRRLHAEGTGALIYLQQEGRGIGLANKIKAYALQDEGLDTVEANHQLGFNDDHRSYQCVPHILRDLGIESVRLLTNNPYKIDAMMNLGVEVTERVPILVKPNPSNRDYMVTKARRMAHLIPEELLVIEEEASVAIEPGVKATSPSPARIDHTERFTNPSNGRTHSWALGRDSVVNAIEAMKRGEIVLVTDDESRENEGDLIMAAELATSETMAFIVKYTGGVVCVAMESDRMDELELPQMVPNNQDPKNTAFTVTVDANVNTTTGISAADRAQTMRMLASSESVPDQFCRPGHVFPLRARSGGVLTRDGHTEASVDLCRLAGLAPAGVLSEVVTRDGISMARMPELEEFSKEHGLVLTTIEDLTCYILEQRQGTERT